MNEDKLGDSIWQVEELIRKHEDFEKTIEAQEEKFDTLKRITLVCIRYKLRDDILITRKEPRR